jgi:hypothetical protein
MHQDQPMSTELIAYYGQLLDYQDQAYEAAEQGNFGTAIANWTAILSDPAMRDFFAQEPAALHEIAWNLAVTHWGNADEPTARTIFAEWGFAADEYEQLLTGARA